jgi:hypothetical protein
VSAATGSSVWPQLLAGDDDAQLLWFGMETEERGPRSHTAWKQRGGVWQSFRYNTHANGGRGVAELGDSLLVDAGSPVDAAALNLPAGLTYPS